ncbi:alpha/beta hydrolase fold domain-containing protein [Nocardioides daphniae]|uniref:alpha/beta hydrolase fold domain-containing protein n=1 Tax=Nocardioides daphniae TaxID=402297 RepID=UPI001315564C|nr:alpha/beta hydrolase [Nocardioides daphniae]
MDSPVVSPSLLHQVVATVLPRVRRARDLDDADLERGRILAWQQTLVGGLPTRLVPGFSRRFDVEVDHSAGFPTYVLTPRGADVTRTVLYGHGGGYVKPIDAFHVRYVSILARRLGARIVLPDYPLAPTHTWRDSHEDLVDLAVAWAEHADCAGERPLTLMGDSAGGGLVLALAQTMRDRLRRHGSGAVAGSLVLHAPWADLTSTAPGTEEFSARDPWLFLSKIRLYAEWWAGSPDDLDRPEVSPALGDLSDLPPALMLHGTRDTLAAACRMLVRRAEEAGGAHLRRGARPAARLQPLPADPRGAARDAPGAGLPRLSGRAGTGGRPMLAG